MKDSLDKIYLGDALEVLRTLPDSLVHTCVTSPPYWGPRDYGGWEQYVVWGGFWDDFQLPRKGNKRTYWKPRIKWRAASRGVVWDRKRQAHVCALGLEPTPELYVSHLVEIFAEVRRVLRDDGTLWIILGDSYNAAGRKGHGTRVGYKQGTNRASAAGVDGHRPSVVDLKEKDLIGIPWLVAFALRADGWWLRKDNIWHKPNPMPGSMKDRTTTSHEYIFHLSKSACYYYDGDAIREKCVKKGARRHLQGGRGERAGSREGLRDKSWDTQAGRNKRSVWTVPTVSCSDAHFAVYPPNLIRPCILAGSPKGGVVLDPFLGRGTTARVALEYGRHFIGIELNSKYVEMAERYLAPFRQQAVMV